MILRALAPAVVSIGLLLPGTAQAQSADDVARADALFNAAKQLRDGGLYADACPQFAQSSRLAPGVGVSLYLADCYEHVGKTASAWTEFRTAEKLARERNDKRMDVAHARAAALEPKLSGLTVAVPPAVAEQKPEIVLDGAKIGPEQWNAAMAVDPGDHMLTVTLRGQPTRTLTAHVDAGSRTARLNVDDGAGGAAAPAPAPAAASPEPAAPSDPGTTRRWIGIGLLGAGAVGVGLGTTFLLNRNQSQSAAVPSCSPQPQDNSAVVASAISYGAGGVALVAGLILTVSASSAKTLGVLAEPMLIAGGGGAQLQGSF